MCHFLNMTIGKFISGVSVFVVLIASLVVIGVVANAGNSPQAAVAEPATTAEDGTAVLSLDAIFDDSNFAGAFVGNGPFTVVGEVTVQNDSVGQRVLRFADNFRTNRGPQLEVILRTDSGESIALGALQTSNGSQAFVIPGQTDLEEFNQVQIWDGQGNIDFGRAFLAPVV